MTDKEYISLQLRNKARLLNSALRISKYRDVNTSKKSTFVRHLIDGGDFFELLSILKNQKEFDNNNFNEAEIDLSGSIELINKQHVFHANGRNKLLVCVHYLTEGLFTTS